MRRFLIKSILFLLPFLGVMVMEAFILPVDFSTFRVWEALRVDSLKWAMPGYFYPRMKVTKIEEGDLAHHTPCALKKSNYWETDRYGFRKQDRPLPVPQVVIIGDSNTAGSALTQDELLSEVLESLLRIPVYPLAPAHINTFFREIRFLDNPPSTVIFAVVERDITTLRRVRPDLLGLPGYKKVFFRLETTLQTNPFVQFFAVHTDRALKGSLLLYTRARLRRIIGGQDRSPADCKKMFFLQGEKANEEISAAAFQRAMETVLAYRDAFRSKGIRFIFLPIPNKETIYYDLLPAGRRPALIPRLTAQLNLAGVEAIDSQHLFEEARKKGNPLLYYPDDTHWNGEGVRITAAALAASIQRRP